MAVLDDARLDLLKKVLREEYVPNLPELINKTEPADQQEVKNLSRAFSAFAVSKLCDIPVIEASASVVDDYDDYGIDAIYYKPSVDTIYIVQTKLQVGSDFKQEEALAFCQGVKKLIDQDLGEFNAHVQSRRVDIEEAIENCTRIQLVIAYIGGKVTDRAKHALAEFIEKERDEEERLEQNIIEFESSLIVRSLQHGKALPKVNTDLWLWNCSKVVGGSQTYIGLVPLTDLAKLHGIHGDALYEKNIRTFLGKKTEVNTSIINSLKTTPKDFFYLNNGVTLLCDLVDQKGTNTTTPKKRKFKLRGASVINGAQTISTAASYIHEHGEETIEDAKITITLIQADSQSDFGKRITRARNHQNPVHFTNFVALDDEQERLRREMSYLGIRYVYKAEAASGIVEDVIHVDEASQALALFQKDPRYSVWLKKESSRFLDTASTPYKAIFTSLVTAHQVVNAVRFYRYIKKRMNAESNAAYGLERLAYKHGAYALGWVLAKRLNNSFNEAQLFDDQKIEAELSVVFDDIRQKIYDQVNRNSVYCGPLALFRNQSRTIPVIKSIMIDCYGLSDDPVIAIKQAVKQAGELYPVTVFDYVISKAPQIETLI